MSKSRHSRVEVQKGPIVADQMTQGTMTRSETDRQDKANHELRRSATRMTLHEPKK